MNTGLDAVPAKLSAVVVAVPDPDFGETLPHLVGSIDVKFEPGFPALGPKLGPAGLLPVLNASCRAHARLRRSSLMLN